MSTPIKCWPNESDIQGLTDTTTECVVYQKPGSKMVLQQAFQIADQEKLIIQCLFPSNHDPPQLRYTLKLPNFCF
jgi:hypothetical protein